MYPLAHVTLACGVIWAGSRLLDRSGIFRAAGAPAAGGSAQIAGPARDRPALPHARISDRIDYRLVALGALLPDLIDKPIGRIIFSDAFNNNGHIYAHTLLFALALIVPGAYLLARVADPRLLAVGVAVLTHLLSDPVTHAPENLFWPLLGWEFANVKLLGTKGTLATETVAGLVWLLVAHRLAQSHRLLLLFRKGRL